MSMKLNFSHVNRRDSGYGGYGSGDKTANGVKGAIIGAGVGAAGGAIAGYEVAQNQIDQKFPLQSFDVNGSVPVTHDAVLGQVPSNTYIPADGYWGGYYMGGYGGYSPWTYGYPMSVGSQDVHSNAYGGTPTTDANGNTQMQDKVYPESGHGIPAVSFDSHPIQTPVMNGFSVWADPDYYTYQTCYDRGSYDSNGNYQSNEVCTDHQRLEGYYLYFQPNMSYTNGPPAGSAQNYSYTLPDGTKYNNTVSAGQSQYLTPKVDWQTPGINVGATVAEYAAIGAGVGAAGGFLLGYALTK